MTGFGRACAVLGEGTLEIRISSVNRRGLELGARLPEDWDGLEAEVLERVRKVASRGKVSVAVTWERATGPGPGAASAAPAWNDAAVLETLGRLESLARQRGLPFNPGADLLWSIAGSQRSVAARPEAAASRAVLMATLEEALRGFSATRAREGEALLVDFLGRVELLRQHIEAAALRAPAVVPLQREALLRRLREAGLALDPGDERVLKEIALFADRSDVSEEITRFRSHLEQFCALLRSDGEVGRKADFLIQELGREANTLGSKAGDLAIVRAVIELKNELERIREQMANVE